MNAIDKSIKKKFEGDIREHEEFQKAHVFKPEQFIMINTHENKGEIGKTISKL